VGQLFKFQTKHFTDLEELILVKFAYGALVLATERFTDLGKLNLLMVVRF